MKTTLASFAIAISFLVNAQTTVYTTGQTYADGWTGWTTPVVSATVGTPTINGAYIYEFPFTGAAGQSYSFEYTRAFSINSNDIDIYCAATSQNATLSIEYSEDNSLWTNIGSQVYGAGFAQQSLIIPTFAPGPTNFYLKIKMTGTIASPSQAVINNFRIDADLTTESVSISPMAEQNILVGVNGNVLTANEAPSAAVSREWKYSTTSGSGYVSFATAQTASTYTPNFASVGTYFVVCESTFAGSTLISNQVQINVSASSGIDVNDIDYNVTIIQSDLIIITEKTNYNVSIFSLSGQLIHQAANLKTLDLNSWEEGAYLVNISDDQGLSKTTKLVYTK
jgi:hypothetical protein